MPTVLGTGNLLTDPQVMTHPYAADFFCQHNFRHLYLGHYLSGMIHYLERAMSTPHSKHLLLNTSAIIIANGFSLKNWPQ